MVLPVIMLLLWLFFFKHEKRMRMEEDSCSCLFVSNFQNNPEATFRLFIK